MIYCERHDDGCWASKPRHDAIPSLMKVSSHFLQKESIEYIFQDFIRCDSTANNFSEEKEIFTDRLVFRLRKRRTAGSACIRLKPICNSFFSREKRVHLPVLGMKFINKFINSYTYI